MAAISRAKKALDEVARLRARVAELEAEVARLRASRPAKSTTTTKR